MSGNWVRRGLLAGLLTVGYVGTTAAAVVEYTGQTVKYVFDTGGSSIDDYLDLYASAHVLPGTDTLRLTPDGWIALATFGASGNSIDFSNDTLTFSVVSLDSNTAIESVSLSGGGDYYRVGGFVGVGGELRVNSTDVAGITAGDFSTSSTIDNLVTTQWFEQASLGGYNDASLVVTVENLLSAGIVDFVNGEVVTTGILAFIEKKFVDISVGTTTVPIPAGALLMASAVAGLGFVRRRRRDA